MKFLRCRHCGNIITKLHDSGVKVECCKEVMGELEANTVDASTEKHVPVVSTCKNVLRVKIGSQPHPMTKEHYIEFIAVDNAGKVYIEFLTPDMPAEAKFTIDPTRPVAVYEYCNLHGLWTVK